MNTTAQNLRAVLQSLSQTSALQKALKALKGNDLEFLLTDWPLWARPNQLPPDMHQNWRTWLILGGRGAGKTRTGAEWVRGMALGYAPYATAPTGRIALMAQTYADAREVMVEGISGLMSIHPKHQRPTFEVSRRRLVWPNGSVAQLFSADDPQALRGPQFGALWADELAKWNTPQEAWDMVQFGLRLGTRPRALITTTPRPLPLLKALISHPQTHTTHIPTLENIENLAPTFIAEMQSHYGGTRLGRQELEGQILEDNLDALWSRTQLEGLRQAPPQNLRRIVVAIDPPAGGQNKGAFCGLIAAGLGADGLAYVLQDASLKGAPHVWAQKAIALYHACGADHLLAEANQGGDMVASVLKQADPTVPVRLVHASRGKWLRAEPVAHLYAQGRVRHATPMPDLEDEMCAFSIKGLPSGQSPDRLDALVWALTELMLNPKPAPRIRVL